MNPRSAAKDKAQTASPQTPFDQISTLEQSEETRGQATLQALEQELRDTEKAVTATEEAEEQKLLEAARAEVRAFAETEPAAILAQGQAEAQTVMERIASDFKKNGNGIAQKLAASVLDLSFLSRSSS